MTVAYVQTWSGATFADLNAQLKRAGFHFFLRWPHRVSGIISRPQLPSNFPSPEGQAFNQSVELRWQLRDDRFDLLWLGLESGAGSFSDLPGDWDCADHLAVPYEDTATRLPQAILIPQGMTLGQRYFRDRRTAIIHFVSLYST